MSATQPVPSIDLPTEKEILEIIQQLLLQSDEMHSALNRRAVTSERMSNQIRANFLANHPMRENLRHLTIMAHHQRQSSGLCEKHYRLLQIGLYLVHEHSGSLEECRFEAEDRLNSYRAVSAFRAGALVAHLEGEFSSKSLGPEPTI